MAIVTGQFRNQDRRVDGARRLDEVAGDLVADLRFHREAEKLHALGPRAVGELLMEIGEQRGIRTFIDQRLRAYAALDPEVARELDGAEFPRPPLYEVPR